jgi:DNA-nicking Smr family endonuclease
MHNSNYKLTDVDAEIWHRYVSKLNETADFVPVAPMYNTDNLSRRLDLHGYAVHSAWQALRDFVEQHYEADSHDVVVVTGRSGQIAHEFREWCKRIPQVRFYDPIETKHGKVGSYRLYLRKRRS